MKLAPMIMLLVIIQIVIIFFTGTYTETDYTLNPYNITEIQNNTSPDIFTFILDPTGWSASNLLILLASLIGVSGTIALGTYILTKSDTILFAPVAILFFGFGAIPIISLYNVFMNNAAMFGCTSIPCSTAIMIWGLIAGPIAIFYVLAVLEWWTGKSTS